MIWGVELINKKVIGIGIILLFIVVGLSGCTDDIGTNRPEEFVGTWKGDYNEITFFKDGECSMTGASGTWEVKEGKLVIELGQEIRIVYSYVFSDNNQQLELTTQYLTETYIKQ